jgi:hypothetical protein
MALMWIEELLQDTPDLEEGYLDIPANNSYYFCSTYDYYVSYKLRTASKYNHVYLGYFDRDDRQVLALDCLDASGQIRLRCVRDVRM